MAPDFITVMTVSALTFSLGVCSCIAITPVIVGEQTIWTSTNEGSLFYRSPMIANVSNGDILAFAGARKYSQLADVTQKAITMRRSRDKGLTWDPTVIIVEDMAPGSDYMNIGTVTVDHETDCVVFVYEHCSHNDCKDSLPTVFMMRSCDWGYTWEKPVNLSIANPVFQNFAFSPGPGTGVQKRLSPHKGRLVSCGHVVKSTMTCIFSDDHGDTWRIGGVISSIPYTQAHKIGDFVPNEATIIELADGSLLVNSRNQNHYHCRCRIIAISHDGGESFPLDEIRLDETLVDSACAGGLLLHNDILFFSNPANATKRVNMTVRWSVDYGKSWEGSLVVNPSDSGYSCLSSLDDNHIGLLYEKAFYKQMSFVRIRIN